ncbi:conserved protein of unknown function [Georgfuchsia toluolica]|uniref:Heparin-sulfate lyase N-terminal domain-containing protein n=1 Tax=Georgfuchsia toluolica TaxID=424218 RepID=A0A916N866_9PROT|nr:alginate lyase family protein [Georgfuchsia toluolica]CAG4882910.1 conserved protein of unknown function [Georgfuchsia toluolica]
MRMPDAIGASETDWQAASHLPAPDRMGTLRWRFNRLRCMTAAEIGHRLGDLARIQAERLLLPLARQVPAPDLSCAPTTWIHVAQDVSVAPYLAAAERLVLGKFDVFALKGIDLGSPPRWNRDPKTGVEAPLSFGMLLDYRDPQLVGDIKYLWEPNRHLHLVTLAQAFALSGEARYLNVIERHLESWFAACPPGLGPNWSSALEAALRLINWSLAWQLIGGIDSPLFQGIVGERFRLSWLGSIHRHVQFVREHFSLYSSANNHLIGEAAGLFIAAVTWPYWPHAQTWRTTAQTMLEQEARLQNAPDGVNREQAVYYQQFELDLLLLPLLAGRANGVNFSTTYRSRIEAMLEYLASIMDVGGNVPMIGDADDGVVANLAHDEKFCRYRSLLATGAVLFGRSELKTKASTLDDKTRWLLGADAAAVFRSLPVAHDRLPVRRTFPDGGYYILGRDFEGKNEIRLIADAGPLGYQSIAAHGHADALAFTLSVGGLEFLIDPGTYAYHTQGLWRAYFRGTAAHNTVRVDGCDQSEPGGNFMWLTKAKAGCRLWRSSAYQDVFEGWHDGYMRLADPVMHSRRITLDKTGRRIVIEDILRMAGTHDIELFFHCSERCRLLAVGDNYALRQGDLSILLKLPQAQGATIQLRRGSVAPIGGWVSHRFDVKQPAPTLRWMARLTGTTVLRSEIIC